MTITYNFLFDNSAALNIQKALNTKIERSFLFLSIIEWIIKSLET